MLNNPARILVADDNDMNRDLLSRRLRQQGYQVECASNGRDAIRHLEELSYDLILLDIMMPGLNGYQVLEHMKADIRLVHIPVVMITSLDNTDSVVKCIEMGADDYLTKPFNPVLLKARVTACLEKKRFHDQEETYRKQLEEYSLHLENQVTKQDFQITSAQLSTIFAMSKLAESKDPETGSHLERLREYCKLIAEHLSHKEAYKSVITVDFIDCIYSASPLHDIGKVGIPDKILLKSGQLDPDEWMIMKTHTIIGAETLRAIDSQHPGNAFIRMGIEIAESHHEKWNGSGYPYQLKENEIPLAARILALADMYDALTSERCYKKAYSHDKSRDMLVKLKGTDLDPEIVKAFLELEDEFVRIKDYFRDSVEEKAAEAS